MEEDQQNFMIKVYSTATNDALLKVSAYLYYTGDDQNLKDKLGDRNSTLAYVNISFYIEEMKYSGTVGSKRITTTYNGFLNSLYNYASKSKLYERFPVLKKVKGISYVLMICCICQAFKLGFIIPTDYIVLEASGEIIDKDMYGLVDYYKSIGFSPLVPDLLEISVEENSYVPMRAQVEKIISMCTLENVSPEMLNLLPVRMCKGMCGL